MKQDYINFTEIDNDDLAIPLSLMHSTLKNDGGKLCNYFSCNYFRLIPNYI